MEEQHQDYSRSQADREVQWDHQQILEFAAKLQDFTAVEADDWQKRAAMLHKALSQERQRRKEAEDESSKLRIELRKSAPAKATSALGAIIRGKKWAKASRPTGTMLTINEDDDFNALDELSSKQSSQSQDSGPVKVRNHDLQEPSSVLSDEDTKHIWALFKKWLAAAACALLLLLLIVVLIVTVPANVTAPAFTTTPHVLLHTVTGTAFSIGLQLDSKASVRYVVLQVAAFEDVRGSDDKLSSEAIAAAAVPGSESTLAMVRSGRSTATKFVQHKHR